MNTQNGYSMIEVLVASMLLLAMVYGVATLTISGRDAQEYASRMNRATEINQTILDDLRLEITSSVQMFGNDTDGNAHLALLDMGDFPAMIDSTRLPTLSPNGTIQTDTAGNEITGNALFYVRQAWYTEYQCTSGNEYRLDVFRWVLFYLTAEGGGPAPDSPIGLNLVEFLSEPMVDGAQIDAITDLTDQNEVLYHLVLGTADMNGDSHPEVDVVWLRGSDPTASGTFRHINPLSGAMDVAPQPPRQDPWNIEPDEDAQSRSNLLSYRHHSVATNYSRSAMGVGRFGLIDNTDDGFPHGFEVQVVGPSSARQLLVHLVVVSTANHGQRAWADNVVIVDARDM